jgi:hypothetical protein
MGGKPCLEWLELEDEDAEEEVPVEDDDDDDMVVAALWTSLRNNKTKIGIGRSAAAATDGHDEQQQQKIQSCRHRLRADTLQPVPPTPTTSSAEPCFIMGWMFYWLSMTSRTCEGLAAARRTTTSPRSVVETLSPLGVKTTNNNRDTKNNNNNGSSGSPSHSKSDTTVDSCCSSSTSASSSSSMHGGGEEPLVVRKDHPSMTTRAAGSKVVTATSLLCRIEEGGRSAQRSARDENNRFTTDGKVVLPDYDYREYLTTTDKQHRSW